MISDALVRCRGVARTHGRGATATVALAPTDCELWAGDQIALTGPSGSGKSTLLYLMAGLDMPTTGEIDWPAIGERDTLRPVRVAMIFQGPSLLAPLTVAENVALPLILGGSEEQAAQQRARQALDELDLGELAAKLPEEISGGQAQRVAIARAVAGTPQLILADEPTGQLDAANGAAVIEVLLKASQRSGAGLVVSTHDGAMAQALPGRWDIHNGELTVRAGAPA
ncbi:MAG TPA: ABC transporter ATP-binding protein [Solirubrobacteraceae bacterium]|nr:ABC transporter ATP-binding protein [Solirubrobacteraceae bacterium]